MTNALKSLIASVLFSILVVGCASLPHVPRNSNIGREHKKNKPAEYGYIAFKYVSQKYEESFVTLKQLDGDLSYGLIVNPTSYCDARPDQLLDWKDFKSPKPPFTGRLVIVEVKPGVYVTKEFFPTRKSLGGVVTTDTLRIYAGHVLSLGKIAVNQPKQGELTFSVLTTEHLDDSEFRTFNDSVGVQLKIDHDSIAWLNSLLITR